MIAFLFTLTFWEQMIWPLRSLIDHCDSVVKCIDGKWVPARPVAGSMCRRVQAAWYVLTGKADAFVWLAGQ